MLTLGAISGEGFSFAENKRKSYIGKEYEHEKAIYIRIRY